MCMKSWNKHLEQNASISLPLLDSQSPSFRCRLLLNVQLYTMVSLVALCIVHVSVWWTDEQMVPAAEIKKEKRQLSLLGT